MHLNEFSLHMNLCKHGFGTASIVTCTASSYTAALGALRVL